MEITPDKKKLLNLIDQAVDGDLALPQFQRNFVWGIGDVTDLLLSIFKGYFIGTFLLLRVGRDHSPFGAKSIASVAGQNPDKEPQWLILDGQQRVTSLHYVFTAPAMPLKYTKHPYRFFLNLDKLQDGRSGELPDDLVFCERADKCAGLMKPVYGFENHVIPFIEVRRWSQWQSSYERWLIERDRDRYFDEYHPKVKPV